MQRGVIIKFSLTGVIEATFKSQASIQCQLATTCKATLFMNVKPWTSKQYWCYF